MGKRITTREYLESKLDALALQRREDKAANEVRLSSMNEIREQLNTQAATFVRADNVDNRFTSLQERMEQGDRNLASKIELSNTSVIARLDAIDKTLASTLGRSGGSAQTISYIFAGVGVVGTLVGIFFALSGTH